MGRSKSAKSLALIEAAREILAEIQPASIRAVCYRLFTQGVIPSMAKNETNKVGAQLTWAREQGVVPWAWVVDETRAPERVSAWDDLGGVRRDGHACLPAGPVDRSARVDRGVVGEGHDSRHARPGVARLRGDLPRHARPTGRRRPSTKSRKRARLGPRRRSRCSTPATGTRAACT